MGAMMSFCLGMVAVSSLFSQWQLYLNYDAPRLREAATEFKPNLVPPHSEFEIDSMEPSSDLDNHGRPE